MKELIKRYGWWSFFKLMAARSAYLSVANTWEIQVGDRVDVEGEQLIVVAIVREYGRGVGLWVVSADVL